MHDSNRVQPVRQPVHRPPGPARDAGPDQAGHQDHGEQVQADRAQPEPERLIAGHERDDSGGQADAHVAVSDRAQHVHGQEQHRDQGQVAVQPGDGEPRQPGQPPPPVHGDSQDDHGGQQHQRDDPGCPARIPQRGTRGDPAHHVPPDGAPADAGWPGRRTVPAGSSGTGLPTITSAFRLSATIAVMSRRAGDGRTGAREAHF